MNDTISRQAAIHGRIFQEIVVSYPSYWIYPEYKGKPYFSIKYTENGQEFVGYGTYNPKVLSEYLKEYFMPSAQLEKGTWIEVGREQGALGIEYKTLRCPKCGWESSLPIPRKFCPECGSYNGGEQTNV